MRLSGVCYFHAPDPRHANILGERFLSTRPLIDIESPPMTEILWHSPIFIYKLSLPVSPIVWTMSVLIASVYRCSLLRWTLNTPCMSGFNWIKHLKLFSKSCPFQFSADWGTAKSTESNRCVYAFKGNRSSIKFRTKLVGFENAWVKVGSCVLDFGNPSGALVSVTPWTEVLFFFH